MTPDQALQFLFELLDLSFEVGEGRLESSVCSGSLDGLPRQCGASVLGRCLLLHKLLARAENDPDLLDDDLLRLPDAKFVRVSEAKLRNSLAVERIVLRLSIPEGFPYGAGIQEREGEAFLVKLIAEGLAVDACVLGCRSESAPAGSLRPEASARERRSLTRSSRRERARFGNGRVHGDKWL
jgi:hypothetical protein